MAASSTAVIQYLSTWSSAFEQFYRPGVADYLKRFGKTTRAIQKNPKRKVLGSSMEVTVKNRKNRSARLSTDLMAPPPDPNPGRYTTYNVRFDHITPGSNDFSALQIGFQTSWYDIKKKSDATFKDTMGDFIRTDIEDGLEDVAEEFASSFHRNSTGLLGTITAIRKNDSDLFDSAGVAVTGQPTMIAKVTPTAIAHIMDGDLIDLWDNGDGAYELKNVLVVSVNPVDYTLVLGLNTAPATTTTTSSTAATNFDLLRTVIITDEETVAIYLGGTKGITAKGTLDNFFDISQDYFSVSAANRLLNDFRALNPFRIDAAEGGSDVQLTPDHFRQAGEAVGWANGSYLDADKRMVVMNRDQYRAVNLLQEDGMTMLPALQSDIGKSMNKAFGFDGWTLHDPTLGSVAITVDDLAAYGVIDFLDMNTWEMVEPFPGGASFDFLPGALAGIWNRGSYNEDDDAGYAASFNGRPSKEFECQGEQLFAWINVGAKRNIRIQGLDSTL
jgi:hypothetical protein